MYQKMWLRKSPISAPDADKTPSIPSISSSEIVSTISGLRSTFNSGITFDVSFRKGQLQRLLDMINDNEDYFISALKADLGKPKFESVLTETDFMKNDILGMLFNLDK